MPDFRRHLQVVALAAATLIVPACGTDSPGPVTPQPPPPGPPPPAWTVNAAHARLLVSMVGKPDDIAPYLAADFEFREVSPPGAPQSKTQFLNGMHQMVIDYQNMVLAVDSVLVHRPDSLETRGRFSAVYLGVTPFSLHFAITMRFDSQGRVDRWWDHFREAAF